MVWIVCIIICVFYCIYDRQRKNHKEEIKAVNDRLNAANKQIDNLTDNMAAVNRVLVDKVLPAEEFDSYCSETSRNCQTSGA